MTAIYWPNCLQQLEQKLSDQQLNTWIRPLQVKEEENTITLLAPNRFVLDWVIKNFQQQIRDILSEIGAIDVSLMIEIGTQTKPVSSIPASKSTIVTKNLVFESKTSASSHHHPVEHNLNPAFTFDSFVEGKSNQLAKAASLQVAENPGQAYNPLFMYGGVGLGKTHLIHAIGNNILQHNPNARIAYLHSERFVGNMVKALQHVL